MATPAVAPTKTDLTKTMDCTFVTTHFRMGIGRMRQIKQIEVTTTADKTQLRHQKQLIDSPELDEIRSQDGYLQRHLDSISCHYDKSTRFVPNVELAKLYKAMQAYQQIRRPKLVAQFMAEYRKLETLDFAPLAAVLGDQFHRADYAPADEVEAGFDFSFELRPVGKIDLAGLPDFIVEMELEKEQTKRAAAVDEWTKTMRVALHGVITQLFDAVKKDPISGKRKKFYDSHVENLMGFCKTFPTRNLGDDSECMKMRDDIRSLMKGVTPDMLRESENLKDTIAAKLATLKAEASVLVISTGRKFR
jgi:hypothetical protein